MRRDGYEIRSFRQLFKISLLIHKLKSRCIYLKMQEKRFINPWTFFWDQEMWCKDQGRQGDFECNLWIKSMNQSQRFKDMCIFFWSFRIWFNLPDFAISCEMNDNTHRSPAKPGTYWLRGSFLSNNPLSFLRRAGLLFMHWNTSHIPTTRFFA